MALPQAFGSHDSLVDTCVVELWVVLLVFPRARSNKQLYLALMGFGSRKVHRNALGKLLFDQGSA